MGNCRNVAIGPFAGRVAEQRLLGEALSGSAEGQPTAVLVHGEAGTGKTRLVREVTEQFRTLGHELLVGTCVHFGASSIPFAPVVQALDGWALHADPAVRSRMLEDTDALSILLPSLFETGYDVVVLFDAAQAEDPQNRAMLRAKLDGRNHVQNLIVASLGDNLTTPLGTAQAVYRALVAPGIYQELVVESGWSIDQYDQWVADQHSLQLLGKKRRRN